jgi:sulfur carrier protein ThiS
MRIKDEAEYRRDKIEGRRNMVAKLILRDKVYEVKAGMSLLSALQKINVVPESVIAVRNGEMITDDEILRPGDEVKLVAVISGGSNELPQM